MLERQSGEWRVEGQRLQGVSLDRLSFKTKLSERKRPRQETEKTVAMTSVCHHRCMKSSYTNAHKSAGHGSPYTGCTLTVKT